MIIQFNTDKNVAGGEEFRKPLISIISDTLSRFEDHVTRIEVHLSDENSIKSGPNDKRCLLESRMEGRQPVAVTHQAESFIEAVSGAADKLKLMLDSTLDKMRNR